MSSWWPNRRRNRAMEATSCLSAPADLVSDELLSHREVFVMSPSWEPNELERRTAARVAGIGFVPALNVMHWATGSEFDVYAFLPHEDTFDRLMVQCTTSAPDADKIRALKTCALDFGANHWVFVTTRKPHETKAAMAEWHGIELLSESGHAAKHQCEIAGRVLDVHKRLTPREWAICHFLRGIAWLRRVALESREKSAEAKQVVSTWNALDEVFLTSDPYRRLQMLYDLHYEEPALAQRCAGAEGLAATAHRGLWNAMVLGDGTYTQSALAVQTINRAHTLITLAECACRTAQGEAVPDYLDHPEGRRGKLIRDLADKRGRAAFAVVAFELVYGWGGLWSAEGSSIVPDLAAIAEVDEADINDARTRIDTLLRDAGMGEFIKDFSPDYARWECLALLPYFSKGVGVSRFRAEHGLGLDGKPFAGWLEAAVQHADQCKAYEQNH